VAWVDASARLLCVLYQCDQNVRYGMARSRACVLRRAHLATCRLADTWWTAGGGLSHTLGGQAEGKVGPAGRGAGALRRRILFFKQCTWIVGEEHHGRQRVSRPIGRRPGGGAEPRVGAAR